MDITMHYGYSSANRVTGLLEFHAGGYNRRTLTVQYVRGDHLYQPVVTASASPALVDPGQTETITVQVYNPSPDLATIGGTLDIAQGSLNGATPPDAVQNLTIAPHGTITNTFRVTPLTGGDYNPQVEFQTGYQAPVPTTRQSRMAYANAPFKVNIPVTVQANPPGLSFTVDGTQYTAARTFHWARDSTHTLGTHATQSGGTDVQYVWSSWSDVGAISHTVRPFSATTYTANFTRQYFLTMDAGTGGSVSPGSGWIDAGAAQQIGATANTGYRFSGWLGSGTGSYSGSSNSPFITMNGPISETADFVAVPQPSFGPAFVTGNKFQTTLSGLSSGEQVVWQASTDLKNWIPVQTNTAAGSTLGFTNVINPALEGLYFRATVK